MFTKRAGAIGTVVSNIIALNDNELVICTQIDENSGYHDKKNVKHSLQKYVMSQNKWSTIVEFTSTGNPMLSYNSQTQQIFFYVNGIFSIYNLNNNKDNKIMNQNVDLNVYNNSFLVVNNDIHLIGGYTNKDHMIWDDKKKQFESQYTFNHLQLCLEHAGFIHIASRNMLLLMGGYDAGCVKYLDDIWRYSLDQKRWEKLPHKLPMKCQSSAFVITLDEKYIIMFGGIQEGQPPTKDIYIMDVDTFQFNKSKIECPDDGKANYFSKMFNAVIVSNRKKVDLVIYGFIKDCWRDKSFQHVAYPPDDVMEMVKLWYTVDDIHLMSRNLCHWNIPLSHFDL